jgi:hypothetical protein
MSQGAFIWERSVYKCLLRPGNAYVTRESLAAGQSEAISDRTARLRVTRAGHGPNQ